MRSDTFSISSRNKHHWFCLLCGPSIVFLQVSLPISRKNTVILFWVSTSRFSYLKKQAVMVSPPTRTLVFYQAVAAFTGTPPFQQELMGTTCEENKKEHPSILLEFQTTKAHTICPQTPFISPFAFFYAHSKRRWTHKAMNFS